MAVSISEAPDAGAFDPTWRLPIAVEGNSSPFSTSATILQNGTNGPFLPLAGGTVQNTTNDLLTSLNPSIVNPTAPGYVTSSRYGTQTAVNIFSKILNVPPRNTFNVIEGVLTLPATVTDNNTYHAGVAGFADVYSSGGVGVGVIGYAVANVSNTVVGAIGSVTVDSPLAAGGNTNVRLQHEYDFYTNDPSSSVRGTLNDGFFRSPPNGTTNNIAFSPNTFVGPFAIGNASFAGTVMTWNSTTSGGLLAVNMRLEATGVDGTSFITIVSFGTGSGGVGTYNISTDVGTIASTTTRATSSYPWNISYISPDGVAVIALDIGQRNAASALTVGARSQTVQWRYSDTTVSNERVMEQWVEPLASGGVLFLQNFAAATPASYGIRNNAIAGSSFMAQTHDGTGWVDMLHLDVNDRTVVGFGSAITILATTNGTALEVIDGGVAVTNAIGVAAATASASARIYMVGGGNLQFANVGLATNATSGFVSPFPVANGTPTGVPDFHNISNAFSVYNTQTKTLNIYDPLSSSWYHVALTVGAA